MKTFLLLALSACMIGCEAQAQTMCGTNRDQLCVAGGSVKPLACGQYEHDISNHIFVGCHSDPDDKSGTIVICDPDPPPICVDDLHEVTEKQWQALEHAIELLKKMNLLEEEQINLLSGQKAKP